jgi:AcrR family transcriptional regulator
MNVPKKKTKKTTPKATPNIGRGKETRRMILDAAIKVFAAHPYNAASIRMIATQGNFYHGLIRYHFPNKASIFKTVVEEVNQKLLNANKEWLSKIAKRSPEKALALYLDRLFDFYRTQPEAFRIFVQNISHDEPSSLPGYIHMVNYVTSSQKEFENTFKTLPKDMVRRFLTTFNVLAVNYMGADKFYAEIQGLDPKSDEYFQWVKETMISIFLPKINEIIGGISSE